MVHCLGIRKINGFDPLLNAITGLNGSGKSNILDSICFVLGITNLQQVRAANLRELRTNKVRPESLRIVVGGRNKYLINGKLAQPGQVQNLFHSVQLNVNNPHFLIMQDRITKVLIMNPPEIMISPCGILARHGKKLDEVQAQQSGLDKRVNKKVMAMFEKEEDEYNDLMSKKNIIENDKSKIKMVVEGLYEKKKETLNNTWVKVKRDFGSIFSTLLPGTMGKLEPPEGCSFLDGLEV